MVSTFEKNQTGQQNCLVRNLRKIIVSKNILLARPLTKLLKFPNNSHSEPSKLSKLNALQATQPSNFPRRGMTRQVSMTQQYQGNMNSNRYTRAGANGHAHGSPRPSPSCPPPAPVTRRDTDVELFYLRAFPLSTFYVRSMFEFFTFLFD